MHEISEQKWREWKSAKIKKSYISREEIEALKELGKDEPIIIMGAVKGRSTVDTSIYKCVWRKS